MTRPYLRIPIAAAALLLAAAVGPPDHDAGAGENSEAQKLGPAGERVAAMSATLAAAQAFSFSTSQHREHIDAQGERGAREFETEVVLRKPDGFFVKQVSGERTRRIVYDGATLSLQNDQEKVWTQVEMPPTLDETLDTIAEVYRIPMPLADLFYSDPAAALRGNNLTGKLIGRETVGSKECDHLELQTENVDVELWLEADERALPCRIALLYKSVEGAPRWTIDFDDWNLQPEIEDALFEFTPPADYQRISVVGVMTPEDEDAARARRAEEARVADAAETEN